MDKETIRDTAFVHDDDLYNTKIQPVSVPQKEIGIDLNNTVMSNIADTIETSQFDVNALNSFTQVSRSRNEIYNVLDDMGNDSTLAAVLETYAEDATEYNDEGKIVWCESNDTDVANYINYLLQTMEILFGVSHQMQMHLHLLHIY